MAHVCVAISLVRKFHLCCKAFAGATFDVPRYICRGFWGIWTAKSCFRSHSSPFHFSTLLTMWPSNAIEHRLADSSVLWWSIVKWTIKRMRMAAWWSQVLWMKDSVQIRTGNNKLAQFMCLQFTYTCGLWIIVRWLLSPMTCALGMQRNNETDLNNMWINAHNSWKLYGLSPWLNMFKSNKIGPDHEIFVSSQFWFDCPVAWCHEHLRIQAPSLCNWESLENLLHKV